jgi:hypothetical protein
MAQATAPILYHMARTRAFIGGVGSSRLARRALREQATPNGCVSGSSDILSTS